MLTTRPAPPTSAAEWLRHGQALAADGQFGAALDAYDRALPILHASPSPNSPEVQRAFALVQMNRGHAFLQQNALSDALDAYRVAIALLRPSLASSDAEPSWANSLGAALMNFGGLLHRLHGLARADEALAAFADAEAVLTPLPVAAVPWASRNLAGTRINRSNLLLDLSRPADAAEAARRALAVVQAAERLAPVDADLALKARRALCEAVGYLLVGAGDSADALAAEASDLVDEALALVRHWRARSVDFRELALRFFRFGAQLYRLHQPHFLAEFIRENLPDDDAGFRTVAVAVARQALADRPAGPPYFMIGDAASERRLHTVRDLQALLPEISPASRPSLVPA